MSMARGLGRLDLPGTAAGDLVRVLVAVLDRQSVAFGLDGGELTKVTTRDDEADDGQQQQRTDDAQRQEEQGVTAGVEVDHAGQIT